MSDSNLSDNNCLKYYFSEAINPTTGKKEWVAEMLDEHDYITDIARSSYADMLHDDERNRMYHKAIDKAVKWIHQQGRKAKVLDIGTGTGLLSMMAAKAGAEVITAVEVFPPMANIAKNVTKLNGFPQIEVINKHSTTLTIGNNGDMQEKANILITELFDTELIGEGALTAYQHAHHNLMEEDCIAVPHRAVVKAVLAESSLMWSWNELNAISMQLCEEKVCIEPDPQIVEGCGITAVHDMQLSEFPQEKLKELTKPLEIFDFDWSDKEINDNAQSKIFKAEIINNGTAQVVLSWWDLEMDRDGDLLLSTAPKWHHPSPNKMQWRDHWLQSVYFLPQKFECFVGNSVTIKAIHDAYSLSYQASLNEKFDLDDKLFPACAYPPRMLWSRPRLGKLNDVEINNSYIASLKRIAQEIPSDGVVLCASDFSLLSLLAAQILSEKKVYAIEQSNLAQRGLCNLALNNKLSVEIVNGDVSSLATQLNGPKVSLFCGEPYFTSSILPWHDLYFWYLRSELDQCLHDKAKILPFRGHLCASAVWFKDLWKIRSPVGVVEGFDVSPMDEMIEEALCKREYHEAEPHALWEYPNKLLTRPSKILTFNFNETVPKKDMNSNGVVKIETVDPDISLCHGVVLWMQYDLDHCQTISTGLVSKNYDDCISLNNPVWSMHHKQAVFLFKRPIKLLADDKLRYDVTFLPSTGDIKMSFNVARV